MTPIIKRRGPKLITSISTNTSTDSCNLCADYKQFMLHLILHSENVLFQKCLKGFSWLSQMAGIYPVLSILSYFYIYITGPEGAPSGIFLGDFLV